MTVEVQRESGPKRPVRGLVEGRDIIITPKGRVLVDGREMNGGPEDLLGLLGWSEIESGDQTSEKQWDWTRKLLLSVASMIIKTDQQTKTGLVSGAVKIEQVVDRAIVLVDKIMSVQIGYERGRLEVSHLDTAQATAEAMSTVLRTAATNWWDWNGVPKEMKEVVVGVLEDYRQVQAIVLMAEMPQEMVDRGLANLEAIAQTKIDAKKGLEMAVLDVRKRTIEIDADEVNKRNESRKALLQNLATIALDGLERTGQIIIDLPGAFVSGTLTGLGEGTGGMIGKFKEKAQLSFPKLTFLTDEPELAVTVAGAAGGVLVTAVMIGGSVVLLASGAGLGAGVGLFGIWGVKALSKKLAGR